MQIHEITPKNKIKSKKRVGRGGKRGTYSGRGVKGQKSRAGRKMPPAIRELIKRYPKLRGYSFSPLSKNVSVNLNIIEDLFNEGDSVSYGSLIEKGVVKKGISFKILGKGEIKKAIIVNGVEVSKSAKEKIEKAGGKVNEKAVAQKENK